MTSRMQFMGPSGPAGLKRAGIPIKYDIQNAINLENYDRRISMSSALWCDKGEHAFSVKDADRQHFTKTQSVQIPVGNSYGSIQYQERQEITEELDICGPCWKRGNDFSARTEINGPQDPNQKTLEDLEKENDEWQAGYDAAIDAIATGKSR